MKKIAVVANCYHFNSHADVIVTKFLTGFPTDDGVIQPKVKIASLYVDQSSPNDLGHLVAEHFDVPIYPTVAEALTLGGENLAVDGVLHIGVHGSYPDSRFGARMDPHLPHMEQVFRVFDACDQVVPVYCDKELAYSWLDSKWIYDRARELGVPLMAGSCIPLMWRSSQRMHPIGAKIEDAAAVGHGRLHSYGFHLLEAVQCMVERRAGGETGVARVQCLQGQAVYDAARDGAFSMELAETASATCREKKPGSMQEHEENPVAVLFQYRDGTRGTTVLAGNYLGAGRGYAAQENGETMSFGFRWPEALPFSHFSYLGLNLEKFVIAGKPQYPVERTLLTSGILDAAIRSFHAGGTVVETPHLDIRYEPFDFEPIRPTAPEPKGASLGPWPPEGLEFLVPKPGKKARKKARCATGERK